MIAADRTLDLGGLALPLDVVTRTSLVVGQKGTGKTSTAVVIAEEAAAAGARFAVIDPTGAWHGIRSSADGEGPGLDCVVMGGFNGDVPLDPGAGEIVARLVVEDGYSVVCDLERMQLEDQALFVADFTETAYHLCRSAVTILIDEARRFVPQAAGKRGDSKIDELVKRCRTAIVDVVQLGRRKGLGSVLIGQRLTNIAADAREQADVLIIHRLLGANDRKMIATWLEDAGADADAILEQIPTLKVGQAAVLAPEAGVLGVFDIRAKRTFDTSAAPEVGAVILEAPRARAEIDLSALEEKMGSALEAAREDDPESLRRRVRDLEAKLAGAMVDEIAPERVEEMEGQLRASFSQIATLQDQLRAVEPILVAADRTREAYDAWLEGRDPGRLDDWKRMPDPTPVAPSPPTSNSEAGSVAASNSKPSPSVAQDLENGPPIKAGARRMLDVLEAYGPLPRRDLAILSKVSPVSGTVSDYLSVLRQHSFVAERDSRVEITTAGTAYNNPNSGVRAMFTPEEVYALWAGDLKAGARRMMEHLMRAHPEGFTRRELAGLAGISPQSGTVSDYMSTLRRRGLVEERARRVYAGHVLYLRTGRR